MSFNNSVMYILKEWMWITQRQLVLPLQSCRPVQVQTPGPRCFLTSPEALRSSHSASPDKNTHITFISESLKIQAVSCHNYFKTSHCPWELSCKNSVFSYKIPTLLSCGRGIIKQRGNSILKSLNDAHLIWLTQTAEASYWFQLNFRMHFYIQELWSLSPITYTEIRRNFFMTCIKRRNKFDAEQLLKCTHGHANIVLRQTWKYISLKQEIVDITENKTAHLHM